MRPHGPYGDRAAVAVVSRVVDPLEVDAHDDPLADLQAVVRLDDLLVPVAQRSVADDEAQAARSQIVAVGIRQTVEDDGQSETVLRPAPARPFPDQARSHRSVNLGERPRFRLAVVPS